MHCTPSLLVACLSGNLPTRRAKLTRHPIEPVRRSSVRAWTGMPLGMFSSLSPLFKNTSTWQCTWLCLLQTRGVLLVSLNITSKNSTLKEREHLFACGHGITGFESSTCNRSKFRWSQRARREMPSVSVLGFGLAYLSGPFL